MSEIISTLISFGIQAPSGENCQPWGFKIKENKLEIWNIPESDQSLYNFEQKGSLVAHGALIENIIIAGRSLGQALNYTLFPDTGQPNFVVDFRLTPATPSPEKLFTFIEKRATNRRAYDQAPLLPEECGALEAAGQGQVVVKTDRASVEKLASVVSLNERLIFENKLLHNFFFSHIRWTAEEEARNSTGFYLKTLELSPQEAKGFNILRHWPVVSVLSKLGLGKKVAAENSKKYLCAGAFAIVTAPTNSARDLVEAGRVAERMWLTATQLGLSVQPMTGLLFLWQKILAGKVAELSPRHQEMIREAVSNIRNQFGLTDSSDTIVMLFRLGHGEPPSARSGRLAPRFL